MELTTEFRAISIFDEGFTAFRRPGVLVAARRQSVRIGLAEYLESRGFDAWAAANGHDALDLYLMHTGEIDILLLDADLGGLSAATLLRRVRRNFPGIRCCVLAADQFCATARKAVEAGAVLVPSPVHLRRLAEVLWARVAPFDEVKA